MLYPIGIQTFEKLRESGCVYVDKTEYIYKLAATGNCYFLSRPRRFGKSLLVSTLDAYFSGRKDLFEGLAIEKLEKDWAQYPVFHIDFTTGNYMSEGGLEERLNQTLNRLEELHGIESIAASPSVRFEHLIEKTYEQTCRKVVILIDEYDKPLLDPIEIPQMHEWNRELLKSFYSVIKSQDQYIRFTFLTGVTKFSHVSIFSGLNNLNDISMDADYSGICGITEDELHPCFKESIQEFADANGIDYGEASRMLKDQYDGYHFNKVSVGIYNPFSLLNTFYRNEIKNYWFATGTPTYLVNLLRTFDVLPTEIGNIQADADTFESSSDQIDSWVPTLYQSGYLTITGYDADSDLYTLDIPNGEVRSGLFRNLVPGYVGKSRLETK